MSTHNRRTNLVLGSGPGTVREMLPEGGVLIFQAEELGRTKGKEQVASRILSCSQPSDISLASKTCQRLL